MLRGTAQRAEGERIAAQLLAIGLRQSLTNRTRI
jgi:hypothetical protein